MIHVLESNQRGQHPLVTCMNPLIVFIWRAPPSQISRSRRSSRRVWHHLVGDENRMLQARVPEGDQLASGTQGPQSRQGGGSVQSGRADVRPPGALGSRRPAQVPGAEGRQRGRQPSWTNNKVSGHRSSNRQRKFALESSPHGLLDGWLMRLWFSVTVTGLPSPIATGDLREPHPPSFTLHLGKSKCTTHWNNANFTY